MRTKQDTQAQIEFQSPPGARATTEYFARYEWISALLDDHPEILRAVHRDLERPITQLRKRASAGRPGKFTSDTVLRLVLVKVMENLSFRDAVIRIDDSPRLRAFTRLHNDAMMDYSTLCQLANAISPETWQAVNDMLAQTAVADGLITGERLRLDTTAVETNIHFPTDSHLLFDVHRVLSRLVRQVREISPSLVTEKRLHDRAAKKLHTKIARIRGSKTEEKQEAQERLYRRLLQLVDGLLAWIPSLCERIRRDGARGASTALGAIALQGLADELEHFRVLGLRAVDQARRRVLDGESIPNDVKLFSIFEPHTELLIRGKAGKAIEFGHMVSIHQVSGSFISEYRVHSKKTADHTTVDAALARHEDLFGAPPRVLAADKGYHESVQKTAQLEKRVECVSIAKKGSRTEQEQEREHSLAFRLAQKFRAGVEGSISYLKLCFGLSRCMNKGWKHFAATVGATIFAHNLIVLARSG